MDESSRKRCPWTTLEIKFLIENAGRKEIGEICLILGRSEAAVRSKAANLKRAGVANISLRIFRWPLFWCPHCATWRRRIFLVDGTCGVCRLKARVRKSKDRCEGAIRTLPMSARMKYEEYEMYRGSMKSEEPKTPSLLGLSRFEKDEAMCLYYQEHEAWEVDYLNRRINAEKSRLRRIRRRAASLASR